MTNDLTKPAPNAVTVPQKINVADLIDAVENIKQTTFETALQHYCALSASPKAVEPARAFMASPEYRDAVALLARASETASEQTIRTQIALLGGAFPNIAKADLKAFGALLTEHVMHAAPTVYGIVSACRHLQASWKWLPVIADVLEALAEAEKRLQSGARRMLLDLPQRVERAARSPVPALDTCTDESRKKEAPR